MGEQTECSTTDAAKMHKRKRNAASVLHIRRSPINNAPERVFITDLHATTKVNVLQIWAAYAQLNA